MATTIKQIESEPESYPILMPPIALNDVAWQRIEGYIAHRFAARAVAWIVEGPGEWVPPLTPATIATAEVWRAGAWEDITPDESPLGGYWLIGHGPYRFTGSVGGGEIPDCVLEAVRRLAAYIGCDPGEPGARSHSVTVKDLSEVTMRAPSWMAQAMQNSGAADLLRRYRRA